MRKILILISAVIIVWSSLGLYLYKTQKSIDVGALSILTVQQGGTGKATFTLGDCLVGNGTNPITTATCGSGGGASPDWKQQNNIFSVNSLTPTTTIPIQIKSTASSTFAGGVESWTAIAAPYFAATSTTGTTTITNAEQIGATARDNALAITASRDYLASQSIGGMVNYTCTLNAGPCNNIYSAHGAGATAPGFKVRFDNSAYDQEMVTFQSLSATRSTVGIEGSSTAQATLKVAHYGNGADGNVALFSGDLAGTGTAGMGYFLTSTQGGTTGKLMQLKNNLLAFGGANAQVNIFDVTGDGLVGISSSSPWAVLSVNPIGDNGTAPWFVIGSTTGGTKFQVDNTGLTKSLGGYIFNGSSTIANLLRTVGIGLGKAPSASVRNEAITDSVYTTGNRVEGDTASRVALSSFVTGDGQVRFSCQIGGICAWGDGTTVATADTNLYRGSFMHLATDRYFGVATTTGLSQMTISTTTGFQLALSASNGQSQWVMRNATGNFFLATTSTDGVSTTTTSALSISNTGVYQISTSTAGCVNTTSAGVLYIATCAAGGGITDIGSGFATTTNTKVTFSTSTLAFNGLTFGQTIVPTTPSTGNLLFTPTVTGTLNVAGGGTNQTSYPNNSLITSNSNGTSLVATSSDITVNSILATSTTGWSTFLNDGVGIGTSSPTSPFLLTVSSSTVPQLSLGVGAGIAQWTFRNAGGSLFISTSTVVGTATTSTSALEIAGGGFGTTTIRGLNIVGQATSTSNVGMSITSGCYAIGTTCISGSGGGSPGGTATEIQYRAGASTFGAVTNSAYVTATGGNGYFGLGTSTPKWTLQAASTTEPQIALTGGVTDNHWTMRSIGNSFYLATATPLTGNATSSVSTMAIDLNGKVTFTSAQVNATRFLAVNGAGGGNAAIEVKSNTTGNIQGLRIENDTHGNVAFSSFVTGDAQLRFSFLDDGLMKWSSGAATTDIQLSRANPGQLSIQGLNGQANNASLGIGTSTPYWGLTVSSTTMPQIGLQGGINTNIWTMRSIGNNFYIATATPLTGYGTSTIPALSIINTGNVGIGTSTPYGAFSIDSSNPPANPIFVIGSPSGGINLQVATSAQALLMVGTSSPFALYPATGATGSQTAPGRAVIASSTTAQLSLIGGSAEFAVNLRSAGGAFYISTSTNLNQSTTTLPALGFNNSGQIILGDYADCTGTGNFLGVTTKLVTCDAIASDQRLKTRINPITHGLDVITQLNPKSWYWIDNNIPGIMTGDKSIQYGLIAQDLQKVAPELVTKIAPSYLTPDGTLTYNHDVLIPILINSVKELAQAKGITPVKSDNSKLYVLAGMFLAYVIYNEWDKRKLKK